MKHVPPFFKQRLHFFLWILSAALICCGCKSSRNKPAAQTLPAEILSAAAALKPGDSFTFGSYEQDNDPDNGAEPVEWQVLAVENGRALLISRYGLDAKPYNKTYINVTWRSGTLRKWLNGDFFSRTFTPAEKEYIAEVKIKNPNNPSARSWGGPATKDRIFLLSIDEADRYFAGDDARQCVASEYAKANGAFTGINGKAWWWLRSPGRDNFTAAVALYDGYVTNLGRAVIDTSNVVRPAFWLELQ